MNIIDEYKLLRGAYDGVEETDNYILKEYALRDIRIYIDNFLSCNKISNIEELNDIVDKLPLMNKLQDSLILLNRMNYSLDLILIIKAKISELKSLKRYKLK